MGIRSQTFWLARRGHSPEEYEDAFAGDAAAGRFAVADGATESCFAGLWARLLVEEFVRNAAWDPDRWPTGVSELQERWKAEVYSRELPWYAEVGARRGAFATFLGVALSVDDEESFHWRAVAVGDSCLFHTRGAELLKAFPIGRSEEFDNLPDLLGSRTPLEEIREDRTLWSDGIGQPGDRLWLMTDALAHWCLATFEAGGNPWEEMESLHPSSEFEVNFERWIEDRREKRGLRNDDVTLLVVNL